MASRPDMMTGPVCTFQLNGRDVEAYEGESILEVAKRTGVDIPHLYLYAEFLVFTGPGLADYIGCMAVKIILVRFFIRIAYIGCFGDIRHEYGFEVFFLSKLRFFRLHRYSAAHN